MQGETNGQGRRHQRREGLPRVAASDGIPMAVKEGEPGQPGEEPSRTDNPMLVLASGILLLGGIGLFIGWGLTHAYPVG
jgi:hypothetical protein